MTETYIVANRSSVPCNDLPANGNAPGALSLDSADHKLFVAFATSPYLGVVNPTTAVLTHLFRIPTPASALAYNPVNHLLYAGAGPLVLGLNVSTDSVSATPVNSTGADFAALAVDPSSGTVFAADFVGSSVIMINASTNSVVATIPVGSNPDALEFYTPTGMLYVANSGSNSISVVNPGQQAVTQVIGVSGSPLSLAAQGDIGELFVSTASDTFVIEVSNYSVLVTIPAGGTLGIDPSTEFLYIACGCDAASGYGTAWGTVVVYNLATSSFQVNVTVGAGPDAVVVDPTTDVAFSANRDADNLTEILYAPVRPGASVDLGFGPEGVLSPANGFVYASLANNLAIDAISEASGLLQARIPTGVSAGEMAADLSTKTGYVVEGQGAIATVDLANDRVSGYLRLPGNARIANPIPHAGIALNPSSGLLYVPDPLSARVTVIGSANGTLVATVPVGFEPAGVAYNSLLQQLFVANCASGNVSILSAATNRPVGTVSLGSNTCPDAILYDSFDGRVYVTEAATGQVVVLGGVFDQTPIASLTVGAVPDALVLDSFNDAVYVACRGSNSVSAIVASGSNLSVTSVVPVGFGPSGLSYDFGTDTLFVANLGSGTISSIVHPPTAHLSPLTFQESGLPSGDPWSVTLDNATEVSRSSAVPFLEANGTYNFTIGPPNAFAAVPTTGSVTVTGSAKVVSIAFAHAGPRKYPVTFAESTLPTGMIFAVDLNGSMQSVTAGGFTAYLVFQAVNGTHPYSVSRSGIYFPYPSNSSVIVSGTAPPNVTILFTKGAPEYLLDFREVGLPASSTWSVLVQTVPLSGTGPSLSKLEANGTYHFVASTPLAYTPSPAQGYVTVFGGSKTLNVTFTPNASGSVARSGITVFGIPIVEFGLLVAVGAAAAGIAALIVLRRARRTPEEPGFAAEPGTDGPPENSPDEPPPGEPGTAEIPVAEETGYEGPSVEYDLTPETEEEGSSAASPSEEYESVSEPEAGEYAPEEDSGDLPPDPDEVNGSEPSDFDGPPPERGP